MFGKTPSSSGLLRLLGVWTGLYTVVVSSSDLDLVRRDYKDINPRSQSCTIAFHQATMVGTTLYVDGGYMWYNNGSDRVGPNMWLRALDTSKSFTVNDVMDIPIEFIERPDDVPETSAGDLWAYNGALYKRPGFFEEADKNFPGWNKSPKGTLFDFWKYDIKADDWKRFQHNPSTTNNAPIKRIRHAQTVVVESMKKAYVVNGEVDSSGAYANGTLIWDFENEEWQFQDTPWPSWSMGVANHLAIGEAGYIIGFSGRVRKNGKMDQIEIYDLDNESWLATQIATAASENMGLPEPRSKPCSVIVSAKDGSSHNIYMFGGQGFAEVWVLSIPSFRWFLAHSGFSTDQEVPGKYEASTCHLVAGGRKMLVYGGTIRGSRKREDCDRTSIHVFDLTTLKWETKYKPDDGEYEVPKNIYEVIGGNGQGGATLLPQESMVSGNMENWFKDKMAQDTPKNETSVPEEEEGEEEEGREEEGAKKRLSGGVIAGIVVAGVIGLTLLGFAIFWLRKSRTSRRKNAGVPWPAMGELSTTLPPGELHSPSPSPYEQAHSYSPCPQELHAYMPEEMDSNSRYNNVVVDDSYYGTRK